MKDIDILKSETEICDKHKQRFLLACQKLAHVMPFTANYLENIPESDLGNLELLISRFGKLQDTLGRKIIPLILRLSNEDQPYCSFLDRLNKLEKLGLIEDIQSFSKMRELRNYIAHDYPDDKNLALHLNACVAYGHQLIELWEKFKVYIQKHIIPFYS